MTVAKHQASSRCPACGTLNSTPVNFCEECGYTFKPNPAKLRRQRSLADANFLGCPFVVGSIVLSVFFTSLVRTGASAGRASTGQARTEMTTAPIGQPTSPAVEVTVLIHSDGPYLANIGTGRAQRFVSSQGGQRETPRLEGNGSNDIS